jgi:4-hydroxy-tetrahydrodipicolinate synthase
MIDRATFGVLCPTLTPIDDDSAPNADLLAVHCRRLLDEGCHGIVLFGTTGEANSFTVRERQGVLEALLERGVSADTLVVGTGCCAIGDSAELTRHALDAGCRRVLVLPPFYYKHVSDDGVVEAYARLIEAVGDARMQLYLYRIPALSGVDIGVPIVASLIARYPATIAGLKDSSGDWESMKTLCRTFGGAIDVLVGSERFLLPALEAGASGCVTATANANARMLRALYDGRSPSVQDRANAVRDAFEAVPTIAALKRWIAEETGDDRWRNVRPPLRQLDDTQTDKTLARLRSALGG